MKKLILILLLIILVILIGSLPLSILSIVFEYIATGLKWIAKTLNIFGWNGILN